MKPLVRFHARSVLAVIAVAAALASPALADHGSYHLRKLVSDVPGQAEQTDPHLVNGWGIAFNPFGFVWVADNGTGVSTLYDGNGAPQSLVVTIPGGKPTGIVFSGSNTDFIVSANGKSGPARFLFCTENGTIAAWAPAVDPTNAITVVPNTTGAIYKGLTIGSDGSRFLLYAADFHNNRIDVFDTNFAKVTVPGGFTDSNVPDTYGPFNVQNIGGAIYVAYAKADEDREDEIAGKGKRHRGHLRREWQPGPALLQGGPVERSLGNGAGAGGFRRVRGPAPDRQLRRRDDQRLRTRPRARRSDALRRQPRPDRHSGSLGDRLRQRPPEPADQHAVLRGGPDDENHGLYGRIDQNP
jgi:hypothetical protein